MHSSPLRIPAARHRRCTASIEPLEQRIAPATFIVTTTGDSGTGSLRQAILDANTTSGADRIEFEIIGESSFYTIQPQTALPQITETLTIDGYTQSGASQNDATVGTNAALAIVLDGSRAGGTDGLQVTGAASAGSKITGLAIVNFQKAGLALVSNNVTVVGNFIGVDPDGGTAEGNGKQGITIAGTGEVIGTSALADRNLISGNGNPTNGEGIIIGAGGGATITGNLIGTDAAGTAALGNFTHGIGLTGGTATVASNVIAGNLGDGLHLAGITGATIQDNLIGIDANGEFGLGNGGDGIALTTSAAPRPARRSPTSSAIPSETMVATA